MFKAGELRADGAVEGEFKERQNIGIEPGVVELASGERDELAPLVAQTEHVGEESFAISEIAVAMEQEMPQGSVEVRIVAAEKE